MTTVRSLYVQAKAAAKRATKKAAARRFISAQLKNVVACCENAAREQCTSYNMVLTVPKYPNLLGEELPSCKVVAMIAAELRRRIPAEWWEDVLTDLVGYRFAAGHYEVCLDWSDHILEAKSRAKLRNA